MAARKKETIKQWIWTEYGKFGEIKSNEFKGKDTKTR